MEAIRVELAALWAALMLTYLLGDVLRIFSGDFVPGQVSGVRFGQKGWLGIAALMVIPIIMLVLTLVLPQPVDRWANIILAVFFFLFNIIGLPTYPGAYDKFLIVVSLAFNVLTVWLAWGWS
jgi:hypothetical protein